MVVDMERARSSDERQKSTLGQTTHRNRHSQFRPYFRRMFTWSIICGFVDMETPLDFVMCISFTCNAMYAVCVEQRRNVVSSFPRGRAHIMLNCFGDKIWSFPLMSQFGIHSHSHIVYCYGCSILPNAPCCAIPEFTQQSLIKNILYIFSYRTNDQNIYLMRVISATICVWVVSNASLASIHLYTIMRMR